MYRRKEVIIMEGSRYKAMCCFVPVVIISILAENDVFHEIICTFTYAGSPLYDVITILLLSIMVYIICLGFYYLLKSWRE